MTEERFEAQDRSVEGDLSPVWKMLALSAKADGSVRIQEPIVRPLPVSDRTWQSSLAEGLALAAESGTTLVIPVERPVPRAVLSLLAGRKWNLVRTPSAGTIRDELDRLGAGIVGTYTLWPSARTPRIAFPQGKNRLVTWAQRSGVLGGGGNRLWARTAARSPLFTPFAILMAPAYALVVRAERAADA